MQPLRAIDVIALHDFTRGEALMNRRNATWAVSAVLFCSATVLGPAVVAADGGDRYQAALADPKRPDSDRERDATRKPDQTLALLGVEPGMTILDLWSGGGYYTELLSNLVGPEGRVIAHNNNAYLAFAGDEIDRRYAGGRLGNVDSLILDNGELRFDDQAYDAITMVLTYHDIYYVDPENGWPEIDGPALRAELRDALKPGGALLLVDHRAPAGAPAETGGTTHRIDPALVIREMEAAGFRLTGEGDFLRTDDDNYAVGVFDASVRGKTDRFVMRFEVE